MVLTAFKEIVEEAGSVCQFLLTDRGGEFFNKHFSIYMRKLNVQHYGPSNDTYKCSIVERAIRTWKSILFKYLSANFTKRFIDVESVVTRTMNARVNRSINKAPKDVNDSNACEVREFVKKSHEKEKRQACASPISVGDFVRVSKNESTFSKGFLVNFSDEIYIVTHHNKLREIQTFRLRTLDGEVVDGSWYLEELQKVAKTDETIYRIDKVLKKRIRNKKRELFVSWRGHNKTHNSWILESDLITSRDG